MTACRSTALRLAALAATGVLAIPPALAADGRLGGGEPLDISLGRIVAALLISIMIAALALLLIRQRSGKADLRGLFARMEFRPRAIEVVETRRLSPHADICVVRHDGSEFLLLLLAGDGRVLSEKRIGAPPDGEGEAECA